ncbi:MAG: pantetheine-phosphate adenylyltransferase [Ignavibacteriae bacterium]|nr:pantetheine-phosphate adenylyltransferase [Ignavibacteriota bacterium]
MKIKAIYPGTFDPITNGHLDIIERAAEIFSDVIVAVARNSTKNPLFTDEERLEMIRSSVQHLKNVQVDCFEGLLVEYAKKKKASVVVRGLRAVSDFEYEFQMALTNRKLAGKLTTVFLMPHEKYTYLSSSLVREIAQHIGDVSDFVPEIVLKKLKKKFKR